MGRMEKLRDTLVTIFADYARETLVHAIKTEIRERPQVADPVTRKIYYAKQAQQNQNKEGDVLCGECFFPLRYHENGKCPIR